MCIKELEPFIRNGQHLQTGKPFKKFEGLRSRELLANWLLCAAVNSFTQPDRLTFSSDPTGGDGVIIDTVWALLLLTSCSHTLTLVGRDNGQQGTGIATGWDWSGTLVVQLNGKTFAGNWVAVKGGSVSTITGFAEGKPIYGLGVSESTSGSGTAMLSSDDGGRLHCAFVFGSSSTGYGQCEDEKNKIYDLQIQ